MLLHPGRGVAQTSNRALEFYKKIGVGFRQGVYGWMSFVSFSPDGTMVASDGPAAPEDVSGNLKLWSFPEGRLIKKLSAKPTVMSPDWKYYATFSGVTELGTGRAVISLRKNAYAAYAFSPDSRYVAETRTSATHAIRVLELPSGRLVSAFGKHGTSDVAISPDGQTLASATGILSRFGVCLLASGSPSCEGSSGGRAIYASARMASCWQAAQMWVASKSGTLLAGVESYRSTSKVRYQAWSLARIADSSQRVPTVQVRRG